MPNNPETRLIISAVDEATRTISSVNDSIKGMTSSLTLGKIASVAFGASVTYALKSIASSALETAASFEAMEVKLQAMTGHGKQTLEELQAWAMRMPVSTKQAVDAFTLMQAMGIEPSIRKMQILTDVSSLLGADVMPRLALVMGQMAAAGKLNAQDLNQFAAAGVNVKQILSDAFGGKTIEQIQKSGISMQEILKAIWAGMEKEFGGAALKMQDTWAGVTNRMSDHWEMVKKSVMDSGPFDYLKTYIIAVINKIDELKASGQLDKWAAQMAQEVVAAFKIMVMGAEGFINAIAGIRLAFGSMAELYYQNRVNVYEARIKEEQEKASGGFMSRFLGINEDDKKKIDENIKFFKGRLDEAKIGLSASKAMAEDNSKAIGNTLALFNDLEAKTQGIIAGKSKNKNYFSSISEVFQPLDTDTKPMAPGDDTKAAKQAAKDAQEYAKQLDALKDAYNALTMSKEGYAKFQIDVWAKEKADVLGNIPLLQETIRLKKQEVDIDKMMADWGDKLSIRTAADQAADDLAASKARYDLNKQLADKINQLTLSDHDYKIWALDQEVEKMREVAGEDMALRGQIAEYQKDKIREINDSQKSVLDMTKNLAKQMEKSFSDLFFNTITGKFASFGDFINGIMQSIARMVSDYMAKIARQIMFGEQEGKVGGIIGNLLNSWLTPTSTSPTTLSNGAIDNGNGVVFMMHGGGKVGIDNSGTKTVPMSIFNNAPRLHTGLASDEFPTILKKGETVIPEGGSAIGRGVTVNVHNNGAQQMNATPKISYNAQGMVVDLFIDAMNRNVGNIRSVFGG